MADEEAYEIRFPHPAERRACRMLLPRATEANQKPRVLVAAAAGQPPRVIGAVAWAVDQQHDAGTWLVDLHVIPPFRRRGIGHLLLDRIIEQAKAQRISRLRAWDWVAQP
jgi:GNAT superfamily N-acetyltransferase